MTRLLTALGLATIIVAVAGPASSTVLERVTLEEMVRLADLVVTGTVVSRTSRYDVPPRADRIVTDVVVRVDRTLRGEGGREVVVTVPGGEVDGHGQVVTGAPVLRPGEEVVLFLYPTRATLVGPRRAIVGLSQGLFVVYRERPGAPARARQRLSGVWLVGVGEGSEAEMDLDLEELVRAVRAAAPEPSQAVPDVRGGR